MTTLPASAWERSHSLSRLREPDSSARIRSAVIRGILGLAIGLGLGLGFGCGSDDRALESTSHYQPPGDHRVVVETVVDAPLAEVWARLIERHPANGLRILTFDAATHFLVVDLDRSTDAARFSNRPDRFVDCGRVRRSFLDDGHVMEFAHGVAESSRHVEAYPGTEDFEVRDVSRVVDLSARATVYLKPEGPKRTRVTVNSRYGLTVETAGTTRQVPRDAAAKEGEPRALSPVREAVRFTTFTRSPLEAGSADADAVKSESSPHASKSPRIAAEPVCVATGEFERTLIELASVPDDAPATLEDREEAGPRDQDRK